MSVASTAGWVMAVWRSASSAPANVSATIGSLARSSASMLTYWDPWPV
jgi:hypothetical protein